MIPVEQTEFYDGTGKRGNCVAACVASIFECTIEEIEAQGIRPGCSQSEVMEWTNFHHPDLRAIAYDYCRNYRIAGTDEQGDRWEYDFPESIPPLPEGIDYWLATVVSPRGMLEHGPYRGTTITHCVIMRGDQLVWDPSPQRHQGVGPVLERLFWVPRDKVKEYV